MKKLTTEEFIEKAKSVHGSKYDYSKTDYLNSHTKVCIICPEHGEFWQEPGNHIKGCGCSKCGEIKSQTLKTRTTDEFISAAKLVHGSKYDYSKTIYNGCFENVTIICREHGEFTQRANDHLQGCGCPICAGNYKYTKAEFVNKAKTVHGEKYDYSKSVYENIRTKICIICHNKDRYGNEHGEFWQTPTNHLRGNGCPKCKTYRLQTDLRNFLLTNGVEFVEQKTFEWFKNKQGVKTLDFFLPAYNVAIECQGIQHFFPTDFANKGTEWADKKYEYTIENDKFKFKECQKRGIKIYYFSDLGIDYPYEVFEDKNKLFEKIKNDGNSNLQR